MHRSSIMILVPDAEPIVGELRREHDPAMIAGIGAHITLLFPFVPAPQIDDVLLARITFDCGPLALTFDRVERFPGLAYLALADARPVIAVMRELQAAWPAYPLYEGKFPEAVPHLTVAYGEDDVLDRVSAELALELPLTTTIVCASLMIEDESSHWTERARFAL